MQDGDGPPGPTATATPGPTLRSERPKTDFNPRLSPTEERSSSRGESHPPALTEPDVNLSVLCRTRDKTDYAEDRIMPSSGVPGGVVAGQRFRLV